MQKQKLKLYLQREGGRPRLSGELLVEDGRILSFEPGVGVLSAEPYALKQLVREATGAGET